MNDTCGSACGRNPLYDHVFGLTRDSLLSAVALARAPDCRLAAAGAVPDGVPDEAYPAAPAADSGVRLLAAFHPMQQLSPGVERVIEI